MDIYEAQEHLSDLNLGRMRMILKGNNPSPAVLKEIEETKKLIEKLKKEQEEFYKNQAEAEERSEQKTLRNLTTEVREVSVEDFKEWTIKKPLDCYQNFRKIVSSVDDLNVDLEDEGEITLKTEVDGKKCLSREYFNRDRSTFEMTFYISPDMPFDEFKKSVTITKVDFSYETSEFGHDRDNPYTPGGAEVLFHLLKCFEKI